MNHLTYLLLLLLPLVSIWCKAQAAHARRQGSVAGDMMCPPGFTKLETRHCYRYYSRPSSWTEAQVFCQSINTDLLTIHSTQENTAVRDWIASKLPTTSSTWLAGQDMLGMWAWSGRGFEAWQNLSFTAWAPGQAPVSNGKDGSISCLTSENGQWKAADCSQRIPFVCKWEIDGVAMPDGMVG